MIISIIGPENSGKTTLAAQLAKKTKGTRPVYFLGEMRSEFPSITLEHMRGMTNAVVIVDDANAVLDQYEFHKKDSPLKKIMFTHRHRNVLMFFIFHSLDDSVKKVFRLSKYIFVSKLYRDASVKKNRYLQGITPTVTGRKPYLFLQYKRF